MTPEQFEARQGITTIQVREDVAIRIAGLPFDLTRKEAEKIVRVILAYGDVAEFRTWHGERE